VPLIYFTIASMFKTIGKWIFSAAGNLPTAAAQKEKYETQIMLLNAEHKAAIEKLESENRELRAKVDPLTQQLKQSQRAVSFLQEQIRQHENLEDPPSSPWSVGL
jgi:TolA-binding protein